MNGSNDKISSVSDSLMGPLDQLQAEGNSCQWVFGDETYLRIWEWR
jgi:hypothetical protein